MTYSLEEIARATGLDCVGDVSIRVRFPAEPSSAGADDLALAMSEKFAESLGDSKARAAVLWNGADWQTLGFDGALLAPKPRVALAHLTAHFQHGPDVGPGIHASAVIAPDAEIGVGAQVGAFTVVGPGARIGDGARIADHVSIGSEAQVGARALIHAGVRVGARCTVGDDFVAQPNAVIGSDGFSFEPPERGNVEAVKATGTVAEKPTSGFLRIHSLAAVEIGDDVEIGAATTIDRGTIAPTRIGSGTKIDNQVQVGHNVQIGQMCLICAQAGIAGSTRIGDRVVLGGKTGIADHVTVGSDVVCAAATMVAGNIKPRSVVMGAPAIPRDQAARQFAAVRRLPRLLGEIAEIKRKLGL